MADRALIFHFDKEGTIIHFERYGDMPTLVPPATFMCESLETVMPKEIAEEAIKKIGYVLAVGPKITTALRMDYKLKDGVYKALFVYFREGVVLCKVQKASYLKYV